MKKYRLLFETTGRTQELSYVFGISCVYKYDITYILYSFIKFCQLLYFPFTEMDFGKH